MAEGATRGGHDARSRRGGVRVRPGGGDGGGNDGGNGGGPGARAACAPEPLDPDRKHGTVGAVARDLHGHLAAATSTGGITNKQPGRVGDTPIIGAGCYANDATCAVSATGTGEMFIRLATAYDVSAQIEYRGASLAGAAYDVVMNKLPSIAGRGGIIAVDARGNLAMPFNTEGMYRGYARRRGARDRDLSRGRGVTPRTSADRTDRRNR